eukprot:scaffold254767_cov33-Tisochrysis_lutea.AAC.2
MDVAGKPRQQVLAAGARGDGPIGGIWRIVVGASQHVASSCGRARCVTAHLVRVHGIVEASPHEGRARVCATRHEERGEDGHLLAAGLVTAHE